LQRGLVAVDRTLKPVRATLEQAGYTVIGPEDAALGHPIAVVVDGLDDKVLGLETPLTTAPVINADGMSADEVLREVERRADA
jgi:hypothetical protein